MDLKEKIVSSYVAFEDGVNINSDIHEIRTDAFQKFEKLGFPSKKQEAWKYTSLNTILKEDYSIFPDKEKSINLADVKQYFIHDIDTYKIIFIDGKYSKFIRLYNLHNIHGHICRRLNFMKRSVSVCYFN